MGQVGNLIGAQGAAAAGVLGPAEHPGLEEGAVDDQLTAALEQVEQAHRALGPVELILLLHRHPWHPPAFGGQRVTGAGQGLLLHEELLARSLPLLLRHDRGCVHRELPFSVSLVLARCHLISPFEHLYFRFASYALDHPRPPLPPSRATQAPCPPQLRPTRRRSTQRSNPRPRACPATP